MTTNMNKRDWGQLLRMASLEGDFELVKVCVENGANAHAYNCTALTNAITYGYVNIARYLIENDIVCGSENSKNNCFISACLNNEIAIIDFLLEIGIDLNYQDGELLRILLAYDCDICVIRHLPLNNVDVAIKSRILLGLIADKDIQLIEPVSYTHLTLPTNREV